MGRPVSRLEATARLGPAGEPLVAQRAQVDVICDLADGTGPEPLLARAKARCTGAHSLRAEMEVAIG